MGFEDRDYFQNDSTRRWSSDFAPGCRLLIAINIIVFVLQIVLTRPGVPADFGLPEDVGIRLPQVSFVQNFGELDVNRTISGGQVWRLLTHAFLHSRQSLWHIAFNMLVLWSFGKEMEKIYGTTEFLAIYVVGVLVAGLSYLVMSLFMKSNIPAIGASGAVQAMFMLYVMHYPRSIIQIFFVIPIEARWAMLLFILFDLHPVLLQLSGDHVMTGTAHIAHLGGALFGYLYGRLGWNLTRWLPNTLRGKKDPSHPKPPSPYQRPTRSSGDEDIRLDALLAKIASEGMAALTDEERAFLKSSSDRIRRHRS